MSSTTKTLTRMLALASISALLLGACGGIEPIDEDGKEGVRKAQGFTTGSIGREGVEPGDSGGDDPETPTCISYYGKKPNPLWTLDHCDFDNSTCVDTCYFDGGYCENTYARMVLFGGGTGTCSGLLSTSECYEYCDY